MENNSSLITLLAGILVLAATIIIITSGESVAVRFLTAIVALDIAARLATRAGVLSR